MGRCIAAAQHASPDELRRSISGLRWQAPPSFEDYASSVEQAKRGWAIDEGNYIKGVTTIAAAIVDRRRDCRSRWARALLHHQHSLRWPARESRAGPDRETNTQSRKLGIGQTPRPGNPARLTADRRAGPGGR